RPDCCAADAPPRPNAPAARQPGPEAAQTNATITLSVQGLPIVKPPYGVLSAINLDRGEIAWQVPHGDTPDNVRNHPALRGLNIPQTGQPGRVGLVVTKTPVLLRDPQGSATRGDAP